MRHRNNLPARGRVENGVTLVELAVVLLVVAILAAMAYPSYREAVLKSRRAEGKAALARLMQQQERYYSLRASYLAFSADNQGEEESRFKWFSGDSPSSSFYEIDARACEGEEISDCVVLSAWPGTARVNAAHSDKFCGRLTLNSRGERSADNERCWP